MDNIFFLQFQNMVYKYQSTIKIMTNFVGIHGENHISQFKYFDPQKSVKGTNLKEKYPKFRKDVEYIEEHLSEYIYDFTRNEN